MAVTEISRGQNGSGSMNAGLVAELNDGKATIAKTYTVATAPDATENDGLIIYVTDGDGGSPGLAFSDGTDWLVVALGSAIAAE